jgi:DNA polymerase-3 subunit chi
MARADFYILNGNTAASRFSCSIANKAFAQGNSVYIMTADQEQAAKLDDLLWTFQDTSFLPHAQLHAGDAPVLIGWPGVTAPATDVLINLTDNVPEQINSFDRIIEIVADTPPGREQGRARYKQYREQGFELFTHEINTEQAYA